MLSVRTGLVVAAVATALFAAVQADYVIKPDSVPLATRQAWCSEELSTCPLICNQLSRGTPETNTCDANTLTYGCVCSDGLQPNVSQYTLTLPYHTCTEWGNQCVQGCGSDSSCASDCRQDHPCGAQSPYTGNATSTSSGAAGSATASSTATASNQVYTGLAGGSTGSSSDSSLAPPRLDAARAYVSLGTVGAMFLGFMYVL